MVTRSQGERVMGNYCVMGTVSAEDDEKVLEGGSGDGYTTM